MDQAASLLSTFPRERPPLTAAHQAVYAREYKLNRDGALAAAGLAQRLERWMHRQVAAGAGGATLELGAGTLNHLPHEPEQGDYDIVEPFADLYENHPALPRIRRVYDDLSEIPDDTRYRRIISIAVLEHMVDLPRELARAGLLLDEGGAFQAGIPSEGGLAWWLGWRCTTGVSYWLRNRLDYGILMRHEHVNNAAEIVLLIRHFFEDVRIKRFPLPFHQLSFYTYIAARKPNVNRCRDYLGHAGNRTE